MSNWHDMAPEYPPLSRRAFLTRAAVAAGAVAVGGPTLLARPARGSTPANGIHLAFGADPARQIGVSWSTPQRVLNPTLEVLRNGDWAPIEAIDRTTPAVPTVYHHAVVTGLRPGTTYQYRIRDDPAESARYFTTAPDANRSFRFAMFGDMGVSQGALDNLARLSEAQPEFCFVVGDLCYADVSGGIEPLKALPYNPATWDNWFQQIQHSASRVQWMSTVGNHEMERDGGDLGYDNYLAKFQLPGNGAMSATITEPVTYHYRYGNVAFIAADGNDASYEIARNRDYLGVAQDRWLEEVISSYRSDDSIDFIVVGFHNCMYCTNSVHGSDGGNRDRWQEMFERLGVDVVVNGHNHSYERTHPLKGGEPQDDAPMNATVNSTLGTTYITAGGAGQAEYPTTTHPAGFVVTETGARVPELAAWSAVRHPGHSIAVVDVTPHGNQGNASMTIRAIAKNRDVVDTVTLVRPRTRPAVP